jgi:hypothetical protein
VQYRAKALQTKGAEGFQAPESGGGQSDVNPTDWSPGSETSTPVLGRDFHNFRLASRGAPT